MAARKPAKVVPLRPGNRRQKSIQAESKRSPGKSYGSAMNDRCLANAYNHGQPWLSRDVDSIFTMIEKDEKTVDIALSHGRSFWSMNDMVGKLRFAQRHPDAFKRHL